MKIVVTGASGQVASELQRQGRQSPHQLIALGRPALDMCDTLALEEGLEQHKPDLVINAAAYTAVDKAEEAMEAAFALNRDAVGQLAHLCHSRDIPLLHISTDYVFDGSSSEPYLETDPVAPLGVYGQSKWEGEVLVRQQLAKHIILRTSWVFGLEGQNFVKTMLRLAQTRSELRVVADQWGGPTSAAGIASTLLILVERYHSEGALPWGTYHFSGLPYTTWHGFAKEIIQAATAGEGGARAVDVTAITTAEYPTLAKRPANSRLEGTLLRQTFGIEPDNWRLQLRQILPQLLSLHLGS
ncbi:dTDP-4-dehydrorhamnose reductase [Ectothiorhodospiraceae bacterium BW-2]|nr:dTDP-4-dehydrorhamnose reductase [Ectothiorhodospiraceae bacterium BW-2]